MNATHKVFKVSEARKMLPYVGSIVHDIAATWAEIVKMRTHMEDIEKQKLDTTQIKNDLNAEVDRINGYIKEIEDLGCFVQEFRRGILVWPSLRNGAKIFLCWSLGETDIAYWHELDEAFKDRRPFSGVMME